MTYYSAKYVLFNFIHFQIFERSFHKGEMVTVLQGYVLWLIRVASMLETNCIGDNFKMLAASFANTATKTHLTSTSDTIIQKMSPR